MSISRKNFLRTMAALRISPAFAAEDSGAASNNILDLTQGKLPPQSDITE
jgi:hypothetical protein